MFRVGSVVGVGRRGPRGGQAAGQLARRGHQRGRAAPAHTCTQAGVRPGRRAGRAGLTVLTVGGRGLLVRRRGRRAQQHGRGGDPLQEGVQLAQRQRVVQRLQRPDGRHAAEALHRRCTDERSVSAGRCARVAGGHSPLLDAAVGIMTRRLGAELEPEITAVLNRPAADSLPRAPSPSIFR